MGVERVGLVASLIINAGLLASTVYTKLVEDPQKATKQDIARVDSSLFSTGNELRALDGRVIMLDDRVIMLNNQVAGFDNQVAGLDNRVARAAQQMDELTRGATDGRLVRQLVCDNLNQNYVFLTGTLMDDNRCRAVLENMHQNKLEELREIESYLQDDGDLDDPNQLT